MQRVRFDGACWLWAGFVQPDGYARTVIGGVRLGVHEVAYSLFLGPVPAGLEVDHVRERCHPDMVTRRSCCNPAHLEAVTREENMRRMRHPWPSEPSALTHCVNGHEYTNDNTYVRGDGSKYCRECARVGNAVRRQNRKAAANTDVRPTIVHLGELCCSAIVRDAKRERLAVKAVAR